MGRSSVNEVSTSGRSNESDSEGEGGFEQFPGFSLQLVSYPLGSDAFREFCKAKGALGGKWGKCVEFAGRQFRGCTVAEGEEYFYPLADLEVEKRDRGIDESISLEYFDGDVRSDLSEGFLCYLSQLEYGLCLPLTNLANGVMNAIGACPIQMNGNMWEVITICDHLNDRWERENKVARLVKGIWLGIEEQEFELKKAKNELEKNLARAKTDALKEIKQLKATHAVAIGQLQVETNANLNEAAKKRDRLVLDNQWDDAEIPVDGSEKAIKKMSLRINDLESGLAREIVTSKALLSVQAELQVELDASRARKDHALMCNREFVEQFDRVNEANENWEDQMYNDMLEGNDDRMLDAGDLFEVEPGVPLYDMPFAYWWGIVQMMGLFPGHRLSLLKGFAMDIVDQEDEDAAAAV
ncbi:hypothetical protein GIB67_007157 [Kingdonia uniflora]|uniref:Uncharacterized protein n=1 Tax=Kingdonia uniflora TaxID=39325 RepID=A0A7J7MLR9_9MAGN|nr:hypothetical protein GIB67_007157 [Kingdonia uniflora]